MTYVNAFSIVRKIFSENQHMGSVEFHLVNKISYEAFDLFIRKWVGIKL
jgi:hypothetical protein